MAKPGTIAEIVDANPAVRRYHEHVRAKERAIAELRETEGVWQGQWRRFRASGTRLQVISVKASDDDPIALSITVREETRAGAIYGIELETLLADTWWEVA